MAGRKVVPAYRFHKKTGRAIVTVYGVGGERKSFLLPGKYESPESRREYKRILTTLAANDGQMPKPEPKAPDLLVSELMLQFMEKRVIPYYVDPVTKGPTPVIGDNCLSPLCCLI